MTRDEIIRTLREQAPDLHQRFGVSSIRLFGSIARGDDHPESDVDVLVEFDRPTGLLGLCRVKFYLEDALGRSVDVGTPNSLKDLIRDSVMREALRVA